jgi:uncharacterized membrane protein HdeD (DUF308 family)
MSNTTTFTPGQTLASALGGALSKNWWLLLVRGIAAIIFGALMFIWPGVSLLSLALLWGAFVFVDGIFSLGAAIAGDGKGASSRWWLALVGVAGIAAGLLTFFWPGKTAFILLMFLAVWALVVGVLQIVGAFRLRKVIQNEWLMGLSGLLSIAVGALLIWRPGTGALAVVWTIGIYAIVAGIMYVGLAFKLKSFGHAD